MMYSYSNNITSVDIVKDMSILYSVNSNETYNFATTLRPRVTIGLLFEHGLLLFQPSIKHKEPTQCYI